MQPTDRTTLATANTNIGNLQTGAYYYVVTTGSANAYVAATPALAAYAAGNIVHFKANFTNSGSSTLNVNGLGAKTLKKIDGATNLASGDIQSGQCYVAIYDGTNFIMVSPLGNGATQYTHKTVHASGANSTTLTNPTAGTPYTLFDTHTYTIPADDLVAGVGYEFEVLIDFTRAASTSISAAVRLGTTVMNVLSITPGASGTYVLRGTLLGTAASGASVAVRSQATMNSSVGAVPVAHNYASTNVATNGSLVLQFAFHFDTSDGGNNATIRMARIAKLSASAFS